MRTLTLAAILVLLLVPAASAQSPDVDPCSLLTAAEIKAATGLNVIEMKPRPPAPATVGQGCDISLGTPPDGGAIVVRQLGPGETPALLMANLKTQNVEYTEVPGLGVPAFSVSPVAGLGTPQMNAFKGGIHLTIQFLVFSKPETEMKTAPVKLMPAALARLK
jgi:hypothetical protein